MAKKRKILLDQKKLNEYIVILREFYNTEDSDKEQELLDKQYDMGKELFEHSNVKQVISGLILMEKPNTIIYKVLEILDYEVK